MNKSVKKIIDMFFAQKTLYEKVNGTYKDPKNHPEKLQTEAIVDYEVGDMTVMAIPNPRPYVMNKSQLNNTKKKQDKTITYTFPCDIGDTVYICTFCDEWYPPEQIDKCEFTIVDIRITPEHIIFQGERENGSNSYFRMEDIGVNVFLSKEEALPKMAEGIKDNFTLENLFKNKEKKI